MARTPPRARRTPRGARCSTPRTGPSRARRSCDSWSSAPWIIPGPNSTRKIVKIIDTKYGGSDIAADRITSLPDPVKERLLAMSDQRITDEGVVVIKAQTSRSQTPSSGPTAQGVAANTIEVDSILPSSDREM